MRGLGVVVKGLPPFVRLSMTVLCATAQSVLMQCRCVMETGGGRNLMNEECYCWLASVDFELLHNHAFQALVVQVSRIAFGTGLFRVRLRARDVRFPIISGADCVLICA